MNQFDDPFDPFGDDNQPGSDCFDNPEDDSLFETVQPEPIQNDCFHDAGLLPDEPEPGQLPDIMEHGIHSIDDIAFTGSDPKYWLDQASYEKKEADNAYFWYQSYLKDGNLDKAQSWLNSYENHKEKAESCINKAKSAK
jgi:hypothetical protein